MYIITKISVFTPHEAKVVRSAVEGKLLSTARSLLRWEEMVETDSVPIQRKRQRNSSSLARGLEKDALASGTIYRTSPGTEELCQEPSSDAWVKKHVRVNTRLTYTSTRYSLAAEDFEAGARLLNLCIEHLNGNAVSLMSGSAAADSVGYFDIDPTKLIDLLIALEAHAPEAAQTWTCLHSNRCFSSVQLIGFHLRRSLGNTRLRLFPSSLISALVSQLGLQPDTIYVHLYENEIHTHSAVKHVASNKCSLGTILTCRGLDILGSIFRALHWNEGCFRCVKRLERMGLYIYESTMLREAAFHELENKFNHQASHTVGSVLDMVEILGPALACSVPLLSRVLRYLSCTDYNDGDEGKLVRIYARCFLPCISRVAANPVLNNLLWDLISRLSFPRRGEVYSLTRKLSDRWPAALKESHSRAGSATHRILRRLSRENVKMMGKKLGKLMTRFPLTSSVILLEQVEAYPNMIQPVVEALKYCGSLSLDILLHELLRRLSIERDKLKADGQHFATWFSSLCSFTGVFCKRFRVELSAVLLYIIRTLEHNQNFDLLILRELISSMSGIDVIRDVSEENLLSLSGGPCFKFSHLESNQAGADYTKSSARLKAAMSLYIDTDPLASKLLVLTAKCRQNIARNVQEDQLKFVSQWFDECHLVLLQYVSFLRNAYTASERVNLLPGARELCKRHCIEPAVVYHMLRQNTIHMAEQSTVTTQYSDHNCRFMMISKDWKDTVPEKIHRYISSDMYFTFWGLELDDIFVPTEQYLKLEKKYEENIGSCEQMLRANAADTQLLRNRVSSYCKILQDLQSERHAKEASVRKLKHVLKSKVEKWIKFEVRNNAVLSLLQFMIYPRVKLSGTDALYAACFISLLQELDVPMFNTLLFHDSLFRSFQLSIYSCSQRETSQMGVFMSRSLSQLTRWLEDRTHKMEFDLPKVDFSTHKSNFIGSVHHKFTFYNWQVCLTKAIIAQLSVPGFMELRSALEVLVCMITVFPVFRSHGRRIRSRVEKLVKLEARGDIQTIATRYLAMLNTTEQRWIADQLFTCIR